MYHADASRDSEIYDEGDRYLLSGKPDFYPEIELNDASVHQTVGRASNLSRAVKDNTTANKRPDPFDKWI
jgi:hypothetical protein